MEITNSFESAYYRRLILAFVIDEQKHINSKDLSELLGWPKRTVYTNLQGVKSLGIEIEYIGSRRTGGYQLNSWGPFRKSWIKDHFEEIKSALIDL